MKKLLFVGLLLASCGSPPQSTTSEPPVKSTNAPDLPQNPFETLHVAFEGMPEVSKIKDLVEGVEEKYSLPKTSEYALKVGSAVIAMKKQSKVGVTEMDILKHVYQYGDVTKSFPEQVAVSFLYLERTK